MKKSSRFVESLDRARHTHKNTDLGGKRIEKLEEVISHLIVCLEEIQKNAEKLVF